MEHAAVAAPLVPAPPTGHAKHYVFVDEYNRHKRLKVMRACDGCRKRKIRCDGALQNGPWPCGACVRLKLKCIPPSLDQDNDQATAGGEAEHETSQFALQPASFAAQPHQTVPRSADLIARPPLARGWSTSTNAVGQLSTPVSMDHALDGASGMYPAELFGQHMAPRLRRSYSEDDYLGNTTGSAVNAGQDFFPHARPLPTGAPTPPRPIPLQSSVSPTSNDDPENVEATVKELSGQMGDLTIDHLSVAPWIANQKKHLSEAPTVEEADVLLPPSVFTDARVAIPPEMMPDDARCMDYFGYFFTYIHPYVPVLNRKQFYDRWRGARHTISPLLLEGVFACVARYLEDITEVRRWLALAARHEESFKDVPRLSTIQAMLLLTKAREYVPKRGYYYRSWMSVKYMINMAFDLGLNEHYRQHRYGHSCPLPRADCMTRTRIWQTLFTLELLVGAPQGRADFSIELDTVNVDIPAPSPDLDSFEYHTSRRAAIMAQCVRNIKVTNQMFQSMRWQRKDWPLDPGFIRHNDDIPSWFDSLPSDMQIAYEDDGMPPYLGNEHFVAYLHIHHWLIVIMHHRPQLQTLLEKRDPRWRASLDICLRASEKLCQLQEALLNTFGLHGLQFMVRGINYSIYCVLSCLMLHLAAITSPDPETNINARKYFTRHMRVLEHCMPGASQDVQVQISALREAFSADINKPFELKPTLGIRSPFLGSNPTPPGLHHSNNGGQIQDNSAWAVVANVNSTMPKSSPADYSSNGNGNGGLEVNHLDGQSLYDSPSAVPAFSMPNSASYSAHISPIHSANATGYALESQLSNEVTQHTPVWDPSGIFSHWHQAFGGGSQHAQPTPSIVAGGVAETQMQTQMMQHQQQQSRQLAAASTSSPHALYATQQSQPQHSQSSMLGSHQGQPQLSSLSSTQQSHLSHLPSNSTQSHQVGPVSNASPSSLSAASQTAGNNSDHQHQQQQQQGVQASVPAAVLPTVTPNMWQDAFTNAFVSGHGQKRFREEDLSGIDSKYSGQTIGGAVGNGGDPYAHSNKRRG